MGNAPTHSRMNITGMSIDRFDATDDWRRLDEWDNLAFMQQLGLAPSMEKRRRLDVPEGRHRGSRVPGFRAPECVHTLGQPARLLQTRTRMSDRSFTAASRRTARLLLRALLRLAI